MNKNRSVALVVTTAGAVLAATSAPALAGTTTGSPDPGGTDVFSAHQCYGNTCIYVNGKGLRVNYATVTNRRGKYVGHGNISSTYDGATHRSPAILRRGQSWRFDYHRIMRDGNKVCGSIEGMDVACVKIKK